MSNLVSSGKVILRSGKPITKESFNFLGITSLKAWYAARLQPAIADNTAVSAWTDFSGNSTVIGQATGANQPKYRTNILNGLPAWQFDGTNDQMLFTDLTMTKNLAGISTYIVYKRSAGTGASQTLIQFVNGSGTARHSIALNAGASFNQIFSACRRVTETAALAIIPHQDTQFHVIGNVTNYTADGVFLWHDRRIKICALIGGTAGASSQNVNESTGAQVGGITSSFLNGYIAELIFCQAAHSQTESKNIMGALAKIYGGLPQ